MWPCCVFLQIVLKRVKLVVWSNGSDLANRKKMAAMTGLELQVEAAAPLIHTHVRHCHVGVGDGEDLARLHTHARLTSSSGTAHHLTVLSLPILLPIPFPFTCISLFLDCHLSSSTPWAERTVDVVRDR